MAVKLLLCGACKWPVHVTVWQLRALRKVGARPVCVACGGKYTRKSSGD